MILDALVIFAYFAVIIGIGLSQRSKSGSVEGFTLGTLVTFCVAACFRTSRRAQDGAAAREIELG